jgi:hypothetical protein
MLVRAGLYGIGGVFVISLLMRDDELPACRDLTR